MLSSKVSNPVAPAVHDPWLCRPHPKLQRLVMAPAQHTHHTTKCISTWINFGLSKITVVKIQSFTWTVPFLFYFVFPVSFYFGLVITVHFYSVSDSIRSILYDKSDDVSSLLILLGTKVETRTTLWRPYSLAFFTYERPHRALPVYIVILWL